jgi:hypothetical protein
MVFIPFTAFAFAVGLLLGGKPSNLARLPLRKTWMIFLALGIQVVAFPAPSMPWSIGDLTARVLWLISYALLISAAVPNRRITGVPVMALGLALNLAAILSNRGHMPVLPSALRAEGKAYAVHYNSIAAAKPHLAWLVDRWAVPGWMPMGNVFSVGDIVIALGAAIVVLAAMQPTLLRLPGRRGRRRPAPQGA